MENSCFLPNGPTSFSASPLEFGLDDETRCARILHHVTPGKISFVVCAANGSTQLPRGRGGAPRRASDTPGKSCG